MSDEIAILTRANPFRKVRSVNQTSNGFVSKIPVGVDPFITANTNGSGDAGTATGASVIQMTDPITGGQTQNGAHFLFYGVGTNNQTFSARVIGWSPLVSSGLVSVTPDTQIWIPVPLIEVQVTLSSTPIGLAGKAIVATELFADTITITGTTANAGVNVNVVSPANDTIAHLFLDLEGFMAYEVSFTTGASATSCNALVRHL